MAEIPHGEGWPWPKREAQHGTVYRVYDSYDRDLRIVIATDADGTRRGIEFDHRLLRQVMSPRRGLAAEGDDLWGNEDAETLLQAPEAWTTAAPPIDTTALARSLFETDPEVIAFLNVVEDCTAPTLPHDVDWGEVGLNVMNRYGRALRIAWERDEHGWATRAKARAGAIDYALVMRAWEGFGDKASPTGSKETP